MQVWVAVNEADIGKIHPGQTVTFTVDAFPGETFHGEVGKVRLNASMTQNVVTYTVEIITDNQDGRLLPYLTANVKFELKHLTDVLQVPNTALRWTPLPDQVAPQYSDALARAESSQGQSRPRKGAGDTREMSRHLLWTVDGAYVRPLWGLTGVTDGYKTAVTGDDLTEGLAVVTGISTGGGGDFGDARSPFAPQFPRRYRSSKQ